MSEKGPGLLRARADFDARHLGGHKAQPCRRTVADAALRNSVPGDDEYGPCPYSSPSADSLKENAPEADSDLQIGDFCRLLCQPCWYLPEFDETSLETLWN